jgi:glycosyltransferase involved in cell wall biosynthesis
MLGVPHLYDMHSSLPEQLSNFKYSSSRMLVGAFNFLERQMVRRSRAVIVICKHLEEVVRRLDPAANVVLIENAPGSGDTAPPQDGGAAVRARFGIGPEVPLILYTGTFEAYQGLDLLFAAMRTVKASRPDARLLLAGGQPAQVDAARAEALREGVAEVTVFAGEQPSSDMPQFLAAAQVLASPRSRGKNTPLKIYQYLRAGRPIVATNLLTHTQVLDDSVACLADATPEAYGQAILRVLGDPAYARTLAEAAGLLAATRYTYEAYLDKTKQVLAYLPATAGPRSGA